MRMLRRAMDLGGFHQVSMGRSLGNWRTGNYQSVIDVSFWGIQETLLLTSPSVAPTQNPYKY